MAVLRRVAAAHVAAGQAEPEMDPGVAHLQALLAAAGVRFDVVDLIQMGTRDCRDCRHRSPSSSLAARVWDRRGSRVHEASSPDSPGELVPGPPGHECPGYVSTEKPGESGSPLPESLEPASAGFSFAS